MAKPEICVATHAHWNIDFDIHYNHMKCLIEWTKEGHHITLLGYKALWAADARELIFDRAIEIGCSHVLVLDADHVFHPSAMSLLLESKDEAMVSGLVCRRFHPFGQVAWAKNDKEKRYISIEVPLDGVINEVGACAFGCTLVNLEKLKLLEKPWFRDTCEIQADGKRRNMRSDINLCDAFRAAGERVWIDSRVLVGHMGSNVVVYPQSARMWKAFYQQYDEWNQLSLGQKGEFELIPRLL